MGIKCRQCIDCVHSIQNNENIGECAWQGIFRKLVTNIPYMEELDSPHPFIIDCRLFEKRRKSK